jgi:hypothetical protein
MTMASARQQPFAEATPAKIRAALLPEEQPIFDREYGNALDAARSSLRLDELNETLETWRRIAWMTQADPAAHRRMLAQVEHALRTGETPPGTAPWTELKARLGL